MKTNALKISSLISGGVLAATFAAIPAAHAGVNLLPDDTANYAVLYEGSGGHNLIINSGGVNGNAYSISGNIGVGMENGGNPQLQLNNPVTVNGNINFAQGTPNLANSGGVINGSVNGGVSQVETDLNDVNTLSGNLGALAGTTLGISLSGTGGSQTVNANNGTFNAADDAYVYNLTSMSFNNGNTLFINGQNLGANVVINVSVANLNNPHFAGSIMLEGGLTPNQVLFNLIGGSMLNGGPTLQTSANEVTQECTYLDPNGAITLNSVDIIGHVFGGDSSDMQIVSNSNIQSPTPVPVPEASTVLAGAMMLLPLGIGTLRALRKSRTA